MLIQKHLNFIIDKQLEVFDLIHYAEGQLVKEMGSAQVTGGEDGSEQQAIIESIKDQIEQVKM